MGNWSKSYHYSSFESIVPKISDNFWGSKMAKWVSRGVHPPPPPIFLGTFGKKLYMGNSKEGNCYSYFCFGNSIHSFVVTDTWKEVTHVCKILTSSIFLLIRLPYTEAMQCFSHCSYLLSINN